MISNETIRKYIQDHPHVKDNVDLITLICIGEKVDEKDHYRNLIKRISGQRRFLEEKNSEGKTTREESQDALNYTYEGGKSITSLEQAIKFFRVDLKEYKVEKFTVNSWDVTMKMDGVPVKRTNYQVKVFLSKIKDEEKEFKKALDDMMEYLKLRPKLKVNKVTGCGEVLVSMADLHTGGKSNKSKGIINTKDFDLEILISRLDEAATLINSYGYKKVHVAILGDLIESLTGLNHINSWYSMEEDIVFGNAITVAYEIVSQFLSKINNLDSVYMVAGNHDRSTDRNDHDVTGTAAQLVAYMLKRDFNIKFHPFMIQVEIDNICYLLTHGHHGLIKKDLSKIFYEYGNPNKYNVLLSGHLHSGNGRKEIVVSEDSMIKSLNYRAITVQALFTGNFWSESTGFTNHAGLSITHANHRKDNIHHYDLSL